MTLYEFKLLVDNKQAEALWERGVFLCNHKHGGQTIALYQIAAFYVKVYYNQKKNKIMKLRSFLATNNLGPYLHLINIDSLGT